MLPLRFVLVCLTFPLLTKPLSAQHSAGQIVTIKMQKQFEQDVSSVYQRHRLQGDLIFGLINEQGLIYSFTLNPQGANSELNGLSKQTPFFLASHTKAFTGTLAQLLAAKALIDIDAPVDRYLANTISDPRIDTKTLTLRQLLTHTAGFTSVMHTFKTAFLGFSSEQELNDALNNNMLVATPDVFRYSNTGPILAATVMEQVTGQPWQQLMSAFIFAPLNMANTSARISDYPPNSILPSIHTASAGQVIRKDIYKTDTTMHAAGGTISTLEDLSKWLHFNITRQPGLTDVPEFFDNLHEPLTEQDKEYFTYHRTGYSLGWDIAKYRGNRILTRFGGFAGFSFHASFMPEHKLGMVAFFNDERGYLLPHLVANYGYNLVLEPDKATKIFADESALFNQSYDREMAAALDPANLVMADILITDKVGNYESVDGWPPIIISEKGNQLWLSWGVLSGPLYHNTGDNKNTADEMRLIADLGPLRRDITLTRRDDGQFLLINGSISYIKTPNPERR